MPLDDTEVADGSVVPVVLVVIVLVLPTDFVVPPASAAATPPPFRVYLLSRLVDVAWTMTRLVEIKVDSGLTTPA